MRSYILFILGTFESHEEIEYFSLKVFGQSNFIDNIKLVIENIPNVTIIFDSDVSEKQIIKTLPEYLTNDYVKFYFLFPLESMTTYYLPEQLKHFMFRPSDYSVMVSIDEVSSDELNVDDILEKIKTFGVESLTRREKDFLDNFEN
jgi:hypothetical protein